MFSVYVDFMHCTSHLASWLFVLCCSGMIYIDPTTMRRAAVPAAVSIAAGLDPAPGMVTMASTGAQLARAFGVLIRQIADLLTMLQDYHALAPNLPRVLEVCFVSLLYSLFRIRFVSRCYSSLNLKTVHTLIWSANI